MMLHLMFPLLLLILAGGIARRSLQIEAKPLAKLTLYLLSPALIFNSLYHSSLTGSQLGRLAVGTLLLILSLSLLLQLLCRLLRLPASLASAMQLGSVFMNVGNYGLPLIAATSGTPGLERGAVIVIIHQILMFSLAIYFAARGSLGASAALHQVLRMPTAYAAIAALALRYAGYQLPAWFTQSIALLCQACIPIFLLLLGMQLADLLFSRRWLLLALGSCYKLGLAPLLANALARLLRFDSLSQQAFVIAAASPTAVITTMLSVEFNTEPDLVSSLTIVTTLASLFTLPLILNWLGLA